MTDVDDPLAQLDAGPVFVVGVARSGTTWVFDLLNAHPLVACVFESMLFQRCGGLGGLLGADHWTGRRYGVGGLVERADLVARLRRFAAEVLANALKPHHRYLAEKTPGHVLMMREIAEIFPDARFVHVVRDGRDVCVSQRAARRTWAQSWRRPPAGLEVAQVAWRWRRSLRTARQHAVELPGRVLEVRYEDLKADPEASYRKLFDFCGIAYDDGLLAEIHRRTDFETTGRAADRSGFYRAGRVGDWRRSFNVVDGLVFNAVAGDALVEAGYERSRVWLAPLRRRGGGQRALVRERRDEGATTPAANW